MSTMSKTITLRHVHRVKRPHVGYVYKGTISIGALYRALRDTDIGYSLKYQRGQKRPKHGDREEADSDLLLSIHDDKLEIESARAEAIAVKYLLSRSAAVSSAFYNAN